MDLQAEAAARAAGENPTIIRNQGSLGARDIHLDKFSVSNGGKELIQVAAAHACNRIPTSPADH